MEKTNTHYRGGVKRLLAFLLCAVCVFDDPYSGVRVFAWTESKLLAG